MKKLTGALTALFLITNPYLSADGATRVDVRPAGGVTGSGYEFRPEALVRQGMGFYVGAATRGSWLRTFAVGETPALGGPTVYIAEHVPASGRLVGGTFTQGSAYLYQQFAQGTLSSYRYRSRQDSSELQAAIRELEGGSASAPSGNRFVGLAVQRFGSLERAREPYAGDAVRLLSLTPIGDVPSVKLSPVFGKGPSKEVIGAAPTPLDVLVLANPTQLVPVAYGAFNANDDGDENDDRENSSTPPAGATPTVDAPRNVPETGSSGVLLAAAFGVLLFLRHRFSLRTTSNQNP